MSTTEHLTLIQSLIYQIRNQRVMFDRDLARLYGVETKVLNQAVRRNIKRFPSDFMFQLNEEEYADLKSQFVTSSWGGSRKLPFVFTEQGVAMLSGLLNSDVAIAVNINIMRAFVELRNYLYSTQQITADIIALKTRLELLERNDEDNLEAIAALSIRPQSTTPKRIGFK